MNVLVAMSGGVDSSVAAALLLDAGHDVVGCTMRLWGGASDTGCCSVSDVDDARRVAQQLGIAHYVFDFGDVFTEHVVDPYVADHAAGRTPNPCIECNRHVKFDRLLRRADALGFDAVATGHHARIEAGRLYRGVDRAKDQSYVLHVLDTRALDRALLPVGHLSKDEVRRRATDLGLRTAAKPDSQDVCFITRSGRETFLAGRMSFTPGQVVDTAGTPVGTVDAVELVTVGQRRGLGLAGGREPGFAVAVDVRTATVTVGSRRDLLVDRVTVDDLRWLRPVGHGEQLTVQTSAHGRPVAATVEGVTVCTAEPIRRVALGQSVVLYAGDEVVAGGTAH